jgi:hypothetical protein
MAPRRAIVIELEDDGSGAVRGQLVDGGTRQDFDGWLGLLSALGQAIDRPGTGPPVE